MSETNQIPTLDAERVREFLHLWEHGDAPNDLDAAMRGSEISRTAGVSPRYCRFLYTLVARFKPRRILEVGFANGISTAYMAAALKTYQPDTGGNYVVLDPFQESQWHNAGRKLLDHLELESRVRVVEEPSHQAIPRLEAEGERFDLVFLDGNHCLDYVLADVMTSDRVLNVGGLLVLDDSIDFGVALAIPYLDRYRSNLRRIRFDNPLVHWLREHVIKRRRLTLYQKTSEDQRGADGV